MTRRPLLSAVLAGLLALAVAPPARAGEPTEQLKLNITRVLEALKHRAPGEAVGTVSHEFFDWVELARRSLGRHWDALTEAERDEFTGALGRHIDARLVALAKYTGDTIAYVGETVEGDTAVVGTKVVMTNERAMHLDYRMRRQFGRWLIYDVVLDGTSMVASYRAQFARIIKTTSYEKLIERLVTQ
jgi:phospholipid transport system substrate-binding protein